MWQPSCRKWEEKNKKRKKKELWLKFNSNLGNGVAENWREKKIVAIDLWQCFVAEKEGKKIVPIDLWEKKILWQWSCRKLEERERERENCLDKKKRVNHLTFYSWFYSPCTLEYILWSFPINPIKPTLLTWIYVMDSSLSFHSFPLFKKASTITKTLHLLRLSYCFTFLWLFSIILLFSSALL